MMDDANDPELNPKYLGSITSDFIKISDALKEASYQLRARKISPFPIFPICKTEVAWATKLYGYEQGLEWHYYISFLEEFFQRGLIENEEEFRKVYRDADEYCCLFVLDKDFVNFVFLPYPDENGVLDDIA
ncbi:MAG TPA: hypothetical protein DCR46_06300 [Cytophagales bacterium]|nr:hypothetical protein [Cytophagales bacterium]